MDVRTWLGSLGLDQYESVFREHRIETDVLPELTDQHLKDMGVPLGHRLRMLRAILHMSVDGSALDTLLDTGDSRTLAQLIETAGFQSPADLQAASISDFFCRQRFVGHASHALLLLRDLVHSELR